MTAAARMLIVEDEPALMRGLTDMFRARGFEITSARDGASGLDAALSDPPDVILLDIMLPRMNGYEICRAIRDRAIDVPILMLTAKGQEEDIVLGLNLGADDYITKPFKIGELIARVNALLRRRGTAQPVHRFGECEVDLQARTLRRGGRVVPLTSKEFKLLAFFLERPGPRAVARHHPGCGVGQLGVRHAAEHRSVRHDAARQIRTKLAQADLHPHAARHRLPVRARRARRERMS